MIKEKTAVTRFFFGGFSGFLCEVKQSTATAAQPRAIRTKRQRPASSYSDLKKPVFTSTVKKSCKKRISITAGSEIEENRRIFSYFIGHTP